MALAILLWTPMGISQAEHTMVTGHSTFYNGATYDPCLASIAGIMRNRVMWFNDQILVENYGGKGTFIYVTERGAPDPRPFADGSNGGVMFTEGVFYDFVDPNGAHWHVEEAIYNVSYEEEGGVVFAPPYVKPPRLSSERTYVWIVELAAAPVYDEFAGADPHSLYNFLVLVDTCKMKNERSQPGKNDTYDPYNVTHDPASGTLDPEHGHPSGETTHYHEAKLADLWIGRRPTLSPMPGPGSGDGLVWQSQWATSSGNQEMMAESAGHRANETAGGGGALP